MKRLLTKSPQSKAQTDLDPIKYKFKLTKISDNKFNGNHPNGVYAGRTWKTNLSLKPTVGERFHFGPSDVWDKYQHVWTSVVTKILENGIFETENSTYKIEKL